MTLESLHVLLTYRCLSECSHCFVHSGPGQLGTFTFQELEGLLVQAATLEGLDTIWFEGGEPMLYFPLLLRGVELSREHGLESGIVTCGYFANTTNDGKEWLRPLIDAGLGNISISRDEIHGRGEAYTQASNLMDAASELGLPADCIAVSDPREASEEGGSGDEVGSPAMLKGRAAHELVDGLDTFPWRDFDECPFEDLEAPRRVHVDPYGNIHVCQGVLAGNVWEASLAQVVRDYSPQRHPVIGPLLKGGPRALVEAHFPGCEERFASACHACYVVRRALRPRFRLHLGPAQVYGEEPEPPPTQYS